MGPEHGVEPGDAAGGFGRVLRRRRQERRLTLEALAARAGCTRGYLSMVERGRKGPPREGVLRRLEEALGFVAGELSAAAVMSRAPAPVREGLARQRLDRAVAERLAELLGGTRVDGEGRVSGALDEAYRSGELQRLVARSSGVSAGWGDVAPVALPVDVPLINSVAAGYPRGFTDLGYPARIADEYVRCPDVADPDAFAARVVGDSMEPAYREGDIVVFSPLRDIADGDDCFARLEPDDESTFKRVYFETGADGGGMIRLQPVNHRYAARVVPREQVSGLYRAVRVMRAV